MSEADKSDDYVKLRDCMVRLLKAANSNMHDLDFRTYFQAKCRLIFHAGTFEDLVTENKVEMKIENQ